MNSMTEAEWWRTYALPWLECASAAQWTERLRTYLGERIESNRVVIAEELKQR
jgi:hypothetical protein